MAGMQAKVVGMQPKGVGMQPKVVGMQPKGVGMQAKVVGIKHMVGKGGSMEFRREVGNRILIMYHLPSPRLADVALRLDMTS